VGTQKRSSRRSLSLGKNSKRINLVKKKKVTSPTDLAEKKAGVSWRRGGRLKGAFEVRLEIFWGAEKGPKKRKIHRNDADRPEESRQSRPEEWGVRNLPLRGGG